MPVSTVNELPDKLAAPNPGIAPGLAVGHLWPGAGEPAGSALQAGPNEGFL